MKKTFKKMEKSKYMSRRFPSVDNMKYILTGRKNQGF